MESRVKYETITVGELRRQLDGLDDDHKLSFAGSLTFYRLKRWADDEHVIEFNEPQGDMTKEFKRANPDVKVFFLHSEVD